MSSSVCKVVMVEVTIQMPRIVPADWTPHDVEFHMNDSSWCCNNIVDDLERYTDAMEEDTCLCTRSQFQGRYLRDATVKDLDGVDIASMETCGRTILMPSDQS